MGDLLTDLEDFVLNLNTLDWSTIPSYWRSQVESLAVRVKERREKQEEMRRNVQELHRVGARLIANANREYAKESNQE